MKNIFLPAIGIVAGLFATVSLSDCPADETNTPLPTLKDAYKNDFRIGVAINQRQFTGEDTNGAALINAQFNSISPENVLKWETVHPRPGTNGYNFEPGDRYVEFGEKHGMYIIGHTLIWHSQTPRWVFQDGTNRASREVLLERMREHIHTVVGHYKGRIKCWDVVNEAVNDSGSTTDTNVFRRSPWFTIIGADFIARAFEYAHEADPDAILRYNDYSIENEHKRKRTIALIKMLQADHVPVMALGSQTHANLNWPGPELEDAALTELGALGLPIHITELDVNASRAGQRSQSADVAENNQAAGGTNTPPIDDVQQKLSNQYSNLFKAFVKHRDTVKLVTFWGVTDADSWRRNGNPLLFDGNWQPKPAFKVVLDQALKPPGSKN
jgi:endo-1,4-beta-xylanase